MSLSNPTSTQNPAQKFIEWKGSRGNFAYYSKEEQREIDLENPLYIIVLDQLATITGFNDEDESGIWSNEVKNTLSQELNVKTKKRHIASGYYQDIKTQVKQAGGKFAKSVYAVLIHPDEDNNQGSVLELVNFKFTGSSLSPFIDAKIGDDGEVIYLDCNPEQQKKGSNTYYQPIVKKLNKRDDIIERAKAMDKQLQEYLLTYIETSQIENNS